MPKETLAAGHIEMSLLIYNKPPWTWPEGTPIELTHDCLLELRTNDGCQIRHFDQVLDLVYPAFTRNTSQLFQDV